MLEDTTTFIPPLIWEDPRVMIHFTCDLCGKAMHRDEDVRHVVKIEVYAAYDPLEITEEDLDQDHMEEIGHILSQMEDMDPHELEDEVYKGFRFDLCSSCHKKFLKDPLGRELTRRFNFSEN